MRILTFLHSFEPGGVERVALRLVARWRAAGIDAPLFMGREDGPLRDELNVEPDFVTPTLPKIGTSWWETLWMIATLPGHIRRTAPDVLFCAGSTYTVVAVAMKLVLRHRCPPIVAKISNDLARTDLPAPMRMAWRGWLRIQARFVDRWIVMDAAMLADMAATLGDVAHSVIPDPAIDRLSPSSGRRQQEKNVRYLSVGRLVGQKDHAMMLDAFAMAGQPLARLTIIGDGPLRKRLTRQAQRLGIMAQVDFAGHVANAGIAMNDHDVLLLSSRYEGVPAVLIEALAAKLRIVATDCGPGVRAILDHGRLGQLVAPGSVQAFATAIGAAPTFTIDPVAARRQAATYTLDAAASRYIDAMAEVMKDAPLARPGRPARLVEHVV